MKKRLIIIILLFFTSACLAADFSANLKIKTGDAQLDMHLANINSKASTPTGANKVKTELREKYSVSERELNFLSKKGYTLAEIQYLALLAKQRGKPINDVAALHSKGIGWGVMAKRLGVKPSALRKLIVQEKKAEKKMIKGEGKEKLMTKERAKEKQQFRIHTPERPQMKERGMGKDRGH